jgi:hypothetical protein
MGQRQYQGERGVMRTGVRKAFASKGDDSTLTRFVKTKEGEEEHKPKTRHKRRQNRLPGIGLMPYITEERTKFPKSIKVKALPLVSGHNNVKIGRDVRKAKYRGYWIYTLSLEERKTCPDSCWHWQTCYGNSMPWADRVDHTDPDFMGKLARQVAALCMKRKGVLIRLHALGDFFSIEYVQFWMRMLRTYSNLAVYGYTARHPVTPIGDAVWVMNRMFPSRCMVRFSDGQLPEMSTVSIGTEEGCPPDAFVCPEQTGKTRCCATCGACWSTKKNVAFMEH